MKLMSARDSRAPAPLNTVKRAPAILVPRSKSMMPSAGPRSQCGIGMKSNARGSPWRRTSTFSSALFPTGTLGCGSPPGRAPYRDPDAWRARSRRPTCSALASGLRVRESSAAVRFRASQCLRASCPDRDHDCEDRCEPRPCDLVCRRCRALLPQPVIVRYDSDVPVVRKAVFPAAGLGTRFLPVTKAQPKEMLPLVDKPIIQYGVEEALAAGCDQIIIITGGGKRAIVDHFDRSLELEHYLEQRGKSDLLHILSEVDDLSNQVDIT